MDIYELIRTRRSTRHYKETPVEQKKLTKIIEAGRYAISIENHQTTHFMVIKDASVLRNLARLVERELARMEITDDMYASLKEAIAHASRGNYQFHRNAPVLIVTANLPSYGNHMADCACALENMMLMANELDLGSCFLDTLTFLNENPAVLDFFRRLGMDVEERIYGSVAIGYANTADGLPVRTPHTHNANKVTIIDPEFVTYSRALEGRRQPIADPLVVYQGEPGAFSEMAAMKFFGADVRTKGLYGFEDTFRAIREGEADYAILPIENSSTGAIRQVYDLLVKYDCFMVGETSVKVSQNLMALPGVTMEDIQTVYSHEQGLFQCDQFLNQHKNWKQVAQADTAGSAKLIAETQNRHAAAICSARAAEIYGLKILAPDINYNSVNTTRFVVIAPCMELREGRDKVCISLKAPHESGSLYEVLSIFKANDLNLVKLESRPVLGSNWEYLFFIEFTGTLSEEGKDYFLLEIMHATKDLRVYGNFKSNL